MRWQGEEVEGRHIKKCLKKKYSAFFTIKGEKKEEEEAAVGPHIYRNLQIPAQR